MGVEAEIATLLKTSIAAAELGLKYQEVRRMLITRFPELVGEEYGFDQIDDAIRAYLFWWMWGN